MGDLLDALSLDILQRQVLAVTQPQPCQEKSDPLLAASIVLPSVSAPPVAVTEGV